MIGVCIKYFHENYGGMLQAYATTKLLEKMGLDYELIRYEKNKGLLFKIKSLPRLLNGVLINDKYEAVRKKIGERLHREFAEKNNIRIKAFEKFKEQSFTKLSPVYRGYQELCDGAKRYSAVITGSDQLWSPAGLPTNFYNLRFVPDNVRKISYASSFGVKRIPWYQKKRTAAFLNRLDYISMRENRGSRIVEELIGRSVPVVLDPVFMFDKEGWARLIPDEMLLKERYVFAYFLGGNQEHRAAVNQFAKKEKLKIVTLRHLDQYVTADESFGDYAPYDVSPADFLNLLRNAEYVFTDSFHGACFSAIHEKKFMVFNRYSDQSKHSKNSRIDTLCENLGLSDRRFRGDNIEAVRNEIYYSAVGVLIENLRNEAEEYLERALRNH